MDSIGTLVGSCGEHYVEFVCSKCGKSVQFLSSDKISSVMRVLDTWRLFRPTLCGECRKEQ